MTTTSAANRNPSSVSAPDAFPRDRPRTGVASPTVTAPSFFASRTSYADRGIQSTRSQAAHEYGTPADRDPTAGSGRFAAGSAAAMPAGRSAVPIAGATVPVSKLTTPRGRPDASSARKSKPERPGRAAYRFLISASVSFRRQNAQSSMPVVICASPSARPAAAARDRSKPMPAVWRRTRSPSTHTSSASLP